VWTSVGYAAGGHLGEIYQQFSEYQIVVLVVIGVVILAVIARLLWRRQRQRPAATRPGQ
jgi:membrane protein DedA with SNARE-associated domain